MSSKTDSFVKLAIVVFITLLSFSIGTFVGKKYSDNQHELAALEPKKSSHGADREVASVSHEAPGKEGAMSDEEIAKLAEEFVADDTAPTAKEGHGEATAEHGEEHTTGHGEVAATALAKEHGTEEKVEAHKPAPTKEKTTVATTHEEPSLAARNVASGKAPATHESSASKYAESQEGRVPSSLPKDVAQFTVGKFTVQVASYADEGEAQKMASELKTKGYSAFYVPANIKGKTWFRVSVGQFATQKEAAAYRGELMTKAKVSSAIVQKITE